MDILQNLVQSEDEYFLFSEKGLQEFAKNFDPKMPDKNVQWTSDYNVELPVRMSKSGPGAEPPVTITDCFTRCAQKYGKNTAMRVKRNQKWLTWNYKQFYEECLDFANALIANNITERRAVNIIGFNSPEWTIGYFGSIMGNFIPVGVYTTNQPDACHYVAENSDCEAVIVENVSHLKKYLQIWDKLPKLKLIVIYDDKLPSDIIPENKKNKVFLWQNFLSIGKKFKPAQESQKISNRIASQAPGTACTLIYTSGTTGNPKGVICSHDNFTWLGLQCVKKFNFNEHDRVVSYLPLSHIAAQMLDLIALIFIGHSLHFAQPTALQGTLVETLNEVKPTVFLAVPRVYEKIEEKMKFVGQSGGFLKQKIGTWAKSIGVDGTYNEIHNKDPGIQFGLAKKIVYNNVKKALGLDQAKILIFGAAPMAPATRQYFLSLNMMLINIFGMSETSAVQIICEPEKYDKFDTNFFKSCGQNFNGTKLMIFQPDKDGNGEICFKGRNRFMGYYKNEQSTRETIDPQGYLHSGDVGKLDAKQNVSITGRIKELIITAGGENVAPILIENQIKEEIKIISHAMVIGDNRKYLVVLLTLKQDENQKLLEDVRAFLHSIGSTATTVSEAQKCPKIQKYIEDSIKIANSKAISRAQTVRKWVILNNDFTEEGGEMTPTMKLKRAPTQKKYIEIIEKLYIDANL